MAGLLSGSVYGVAAFVIAVGLVVCFAAALHWGRHREEGLLPYVVYPILLVLGLGIVLSARNMELHIDYQYQLGKHPAVTWASRFTSLFLVLAAGERIARRLLHYGPKPDAPAFLIVAFLLFFFTNVVICAIFGTRPWFSHEYIYMVWAGCAALLFTRREGDTAILSARNAIFIFLVLSALCILWRPEMVLSRNYAGLIPGLTVRYAGLAPSPNSLGPLAIIFLLCLWTRPYSSRWVNLSAWILGLVSLLLTQSKTSWVAFVLCVPICAYFRHGQSLAQRFFDYGRPLVPAGSVLLGMLFAALLGAGLMFSGILERWTHFLDTRAGTSLLTLTGRDLIWEIAVQEWRSNPLFGYGLTMWDDDYRAQIGVSGAFSAHSQFFHSLSTAGLVGVAGLALYSAALLWYALRTTKGSGGLSLALFALVFVHAITEAPLAMRGYSVVHLFLLMVLASHITSRRVVSRLAAESPVRPQPA